MAQMETAGVVSRFPHHSHLYRALASKEWCSAYCLTPGLNTPLTTKLSRGTIQELGYKKAAAVAIDSLNVLNEARNNLFVNMYPDFGKSAEPIQGFEPRALGVAKSLKDNAKEGHIDSAACPLEIRGQRPFCGKATTLVNGMPRRDAITKGVAKLGFSWEAMDVNHWRDGNTLARGLEELVQQPGNIMDYVIVQEWVDIALEMRHFIVLPQGPFYNEKTVPCDNRNGPPEGSGDGGAPQKDQGQRGMSVGGPPPADRDHWSSEAASSRRTEVGRRQRGDVAIKQGVRKSGLRGCSNALQGSDSAPMFEEDEALLSIANGPLAQMSSTVLAEGPDVERSSPATGAVVDNETGAECGFRVEKVVYTSYESHEDEHFSNFNKFSREVAVKNCMHGDEAALKMAERKSKELIERLFVALRGECAEMPPVIRFDILVTHLGPGQASVSVGEITELGGCFLGWPSGPETVFKAMMRSALGSDDYGYWGTPFGVAHRKRKKGAEAAAKQLGLRPPASGMGDEAMAPSGKGGVVVQKNAPSAAQLESFGIKYPAANGTKSNSEGYATAAANSAQVQL